MRILGPDGKPISSAPPVSDEVKQFVERAKAIAAEGDAASALQQLVFAFQSDVSSDLVVEATCDLLAQMVEMSGAEQSPELDLFRLLKENRSDAQLYHKIGDRFCQLGQSFVGKPFLDKARQLLGTDLTELTQAVDVGIAQALMDLGDYQGAINAFHSLNDKYGGIPIWLVLEMAECYALLRQLDEAQAVYQIAPPEAAAQFPGMEEVREEVGDLLARVSDFVDSPEMSLQNWHYVQTRGILMELNPDENIPGDRFVFFQPTEEDVAYVVGVTAAMLDEKGYAPNRILWLGPTSEPLARLFAEWWEVEPNQVREYTNGDNSSNENELALMVMAHSYDVMHLEDEASFVDLAQARPGMIIFALDVRWTERQPMCPDIAGFLTQQCHLPWETRFLVDEQNQSVTRVEETRTPLEVAQQIASNFPEDDECDDVARELLEVYSGCTDLILDHRDSSLIRRPVVTHSPVKSPKLGF